MIGLNLAKPAPVKLEDILDRERLIKHIADGLVAQYAHPDRSTELRMLTYTSKCERDSAWDEITVMCNGLIIREGEVVGRPYPKFFQKNTLGLPETEPENFPAGPEVTDMIDGVQGVWYRGPEDRPYVATRYGFLHRASQWASYWARTKYGEANWPEGYTPIFQIVGPRWRKVCAYKHDDLILVALVKNRNGAELPWTKLSGWAEWNKMPVVERFGGDPISVVSPVDSNEHRGYVFRWDRVGKPPLRVACESEKYRNMRITLATVSPLQVWSALNEGRDMGVLKDSSLPVPFVQWVGQWERTLREAKEREESRAREVFRKLNFKLIPPPDQETRREYVRLMMESIDSSDGNLTAMMFALLDDRPLDHYGWYAARRSAVDMPSYEDLKSL